MEKSKTIKRILIFTVFTYVGSWLPVIMGLGNSFYADATGWFIIMFVPTASMVLTRLITKEGFKNLWLSIDLTRNKRFVLFAWLIPAMSLIISVLIMPVAFSGKIAFDFAWIFDKYSPEYPGNFIAPLILLIFLPLLSIPNSLGEEWGWRGYLTPKLLEVYSIIPTVIISGIVWAAWHIPMFIFGEAMLGAIYGDFFTGTSISTIVMQIIQCIILSGIMTYLTVKTRSCLPAALTHATYNLCLQFFFYPSAILIENVNPIWVSGTIYMSLLVAFCICQLLSKWKI